LADGKAVIVGGFNFNAGGASANAELYDPAAAVPAPLLLTDAVRLPSGAFQFGFNNTPGLNFSVFSAPDPTMTDGAWVNLGQPTEVLVGTYEFTDSSGGEQVAKLLPSTRALIDANSTALMIA